MGRTSCEERPGRGEGAAGPALFGPRPASRLCSFAHWRRRGGDNQSCHRGGPGSCKVPPWCAPWCVRYRKILSPFGKCPTAAQPSWALGPAGRIFSIGVLAPQMMPMGSVSDTYSPMQLSKSAEETPKKCRDARNPHPFWARPPSPLQCGVGLGGDGRARSPHGAYIYYICKRDISRPTQIPTSSARKLGARWPIV